MARMLFKYYGFAIIQVALECHHVHLLREAWGNRLHQMGPRCDGVPWQTWGGANDRQSFYSGAMEGQGARGRHDQSCANTEVWAAITDTSFVRNATHRMLGARALCTRLDGWSVAPGTEHWRAPARTLEQGWAPRRADSNRDCLGLLIYFAVYPADSSEGSLQIEVCSHDPDARASDLYGRMGQLHSIAPLPSGAAVVLDPRLLHTEGPNWGRRPQYTDGGVSIHLLSERASGENRWPGKARLHDIFTGKAHVPSNLHQARPRRWSETL